MTSDIRTRIREVLLDQSNAWLTKLDDLLVELERDPFELNQTLTLLKDKRPETGLRHRPRLDQVIAEFDKRLQRLSADRSLMQKLATEVSKLDQQREQTEQRLGELKSMIGHILGPNAGMNLGDLTIKTGPHRTSLKIHDPNALPDRFLSPQPNRKAILAHHQATGEEPAGVTITRLRPSVRVIDNS